MGGAKRAGGVGAMRLGLHGAGSDRCGMRTIVVNQGEVNDSSERPVAASVFHRALRNGVPHEVLIPLHFT